MYPGRAYGMHPMSAPDTPCFLQVIECTTSGAEAPTAARPALTCLAKLLVFGVATDGHGWQSTYKAATPHEHTV